ncbi:MAG: hypothetical protein PHP42_11530 [Bacteroidota bacterium]|nr:hypothetical protein [Bacteroidota bacterium]
METALIAFLGVIVGALLNEYFRQNSRIEKYSAKIFEKRILIYEELYQKLDESNNIAREVIENPILSKDERDQIWMNAILEIANFTDKHKLYLNEGISVHCIASSMGVEDIFYMDAKEKKKAENHYYSAIQEAKEMISKETGLDALDKYFRSITKYEPRSDIIDYLNEIRNKQKRQSKKGKK